MELKQTQESFETFLITPKHGISAEHQECNKSCMTFFNLNAEQFFISVYWFPGAKGKKASLPS